MSRCIYCGYPLDGGRKEACAEHADLIGLDEDWAQAKIDDWAEMTVADFTLQQVKMLRFLEV